MTDRHLARIAILMAWAGILLCWVLRHSEASLNDGLLSIQEARQLDRGSIGRNLAGAVNHPLHPIAIATVHRVFFGGDSPTSWQRAAVMLSFGAAVLWVIPLYLLALELFGGRAAWLTCILVFANPTIGFVVVNVLSESTFLIWWNLGLWASVRFLNCGRFLWLSAATASGILAYWTRPEGLLLPMGLAATLLLLPLHRATRIHWPRWTWALALLIVGSAALAGPYMALKGTPGTRPAIARVLGLAPAAHPLGLERERPLSSDQSSVDTYRQASVRAAEATVEAAGLVILPFAAIGLLACRPRQIRARAWIFFATIAAASAVGLIRLHATGGYCTARHALIPGLFLTLLAAKGWDWLIAHVAIPGRWLSMGYWMSSTRTDAPSFGPMTFRPGPAIWLAALGFVAVLPQIAGLGPARPGPFWIYRTAADHLDALADPGDRVLDLTDWSSFFSGHPGYRFADVHNAPADRTARWIVVTAPLLESDRPFGPIIRGMIGDKAPTVCIPPAPGPNQLQLRIYDRAPVPRIADSRD